MNIKNNKGSITVFVLIGLLFMAGFLIISFGSNVNKSKSAKEQLDVLSGIYSHGDADADAYERAYTELRNRYKKTLIATVENSSTLDLINTFNEKIRNYKIYGNTTALGKWNSTVGKYEIQIEVVDKESNSKTYSIYLTSPLKKSGTLVDYIDYKNQKVVRNVSSKTEESISLPVIYTFDDYTEIRIVNTTTPSKIEVEYIGYEFMS